MSTEKVNSTAIGSWKYPHKIFAYEKVITFKQTNVMGNTYFSNYVEWQGEAREMLLLQHPEASNFLTQNQHIFLVTHSLSHRFVTNTFFGDRVRVEVTTKNILDYSLMMVFRYRHAGNNSLIGEGWQKVCFLDRRTNAPCKVPQLFLDLAVPIQEDH